MPESSKGCVGLESRPLPPKAKFRLGHLLQRQADGMMQSPAPPSALRIRLPSRVICPRSFLCLVLPLSPPLSLFSSPSAQSHTDTWWTDGDLQFPALSSGHSHGLSRRLESVHGVFPASLERHTRPGPTGFENKKVLSVVSKESEGRRVGVHWAEKEGFWGGAWWGLLEVEGLIRAKAHSRHRVGTSPELGNDHMLSSPPSRAAAVPALLPLASS